MFSKKTYLLCSFLVIGFYSCLTSGTHGTIIGYQYSISKYTLEKAVQKVIITNSNIQRDTTKAYNDSTKNDYYNDGDNYITITIRKNQLINRYTFKYAGDKEYGILPRFPTYSFAMLLIKMEMEVVKVMEGFRGISLDLRKNS